ncbi:hypothetical protein F5X99DRAFT_404281 [Biscogniauxia marginata]|nr:hypothetical protein F5X99DRAFT_404281 [Biscogniauxia marginata]
MASPRQGILKKSGQSTQTPKKVTFKEGLAFDIVTGDQVAPSDDWIVVEHDESEIDIVKPGLASLFIGFVSVLLKPRVRGLAIRYSPPWRGLGFRFALPACSEDTGVVLVSTYPTLRQFRMLQVVHVVSRP